MKIIQECQISVHKLMTVSYVTSGEDQTMRAWSAGLTAMKFKCASIGKIVLKSKHEMKERLGCSLDLADALALVFFEKQKRRGVWLLD